MEKENLMERVVETNETEQVVETAVEQVAEAAEQPRMFTQEEVNEIVGKSKARVRAKIEKDYQRKYGDLETVLKAGTGKETVEEVTDTLVDFYRSKGIKLPEKPSYTQQDIEILARADAEEIIRSGYEDVVEEVDRLAQKGAKNMTAREAAMFTTLAEHRQNLERSQELSRLGVTKEEYESDEFRDFAGKFSAATPIREIYDIYNKMKPRKEYRTMGSMKQTQPTGVKDYYTPEEIERLTEDDLDDPKVWEAVRRSMTGG